MNFESDPSDWNERNSKDNERGKTEAMGGNGTVQKWKRYTLLGYTEIRKSIDALKYSNKCPYCGSYHTV